MLGIAHKYRVGAFTKAGPTSSEKPSDPYMSDTTFQGAIRVLSESVGTSEWVPEKIGHEL